MKRKISFPPSFNSMWAELCPLLLKCRSLTVRSARCELIWRQSLYRGNTVKVRLFCGTLVHMTDVLIKSGNLDRRRHDET
jgi:hypothetical protein